MLLKGQWCEMRKVTRKKSDQEYDQIEYLYECPECNSIYWSDSKNLFKRCSPCFIKKKNVRMKLAT